jgi:hypothetical protein
MCCVMRHVAALSVFASAFCVPCLHAQKTVTQGYVTAVSSPAAFDFNGMHVLLSPKTLLTVRHDDATPHYSTSLAALPPLYLGEPLEITGDITERNTEIKASEIVFLPPPSPVVSGTGIIDLIPPVSDQPSDLPGGKLIRADGYLLFIPASTKVVLTQPIASVADIRTNQWITYRGRQRADGIVVLDQASVSPNTVNHREDKLRTRGDYDPSVIDEGDAQSGASKFFKGKDIRRLPAWRDQAMQARVERIGKSLVPAFQKNLPQDDPTRIDFRFQVVDEPKLNDAWSLSSGIILVPHQVVERLPDDSQLAAVIADSIAEVLEKQSLRSIPAAHKMTAAAYTGDAVGLIVPGAGIATAVANHEVAKSMLAHDRQQSGRVSLWLMHDAGYNLAAAPRAWWTLAAKSASGPLPRRLPDHTLFLYEDLGTTWHIEGATK